MSFKANIEITTVEEFKAIMEHPINNISNIDKGLAKELNESKELMVDLGKCPCCGSDDVIVDVDTKWVFIGSDNKPYDLVNKNCNTCSWGFTTKI